MEIIYERQAVKQLEKIPKVEIKKIIFKIEKLEQNPRVGKALHGELDGLYSLRAWPYRILYEITKTSIVICSVAHRQDVY